MRTADEPTNRSKLPVKRLLVGHTSAADYDEIQDCMLIPTTSNNLNDQKRYRKSVEHTIDNSGGKRRRRQEQLKIRGVTQAACSGELSQTKQHESDSCVVNAVVHHESRSDFIEELGSQLVLNQSS